MRDKRTRSHDFVAFGFEEVQVSSTQLGGIHITTDLDNKTARIIEEKPPQRCFPSAQLGGIHITADLDNKTARIIEEKAPQRRFPKAQLGNTHITTDLDNKTARTSEEKPALCAIYPRAYQKALEDLRKYLQLKSAKRQFFRQGRSYYFRRKTATR